MCVRKRFRGPINSRGKAPNVPLFHVKLEVEVMPVRLEAKGSRRQPDPRRETRKLIHYALGTSIVLVRAPERIVLGVFWVDLWKRYNVSELCQWTCEGLR